MMQTPRRINDPANSLAVVVAVVLSALLLLGQALFIVPAGKVAVVTTLGKVSGGSRLPGLNLKVPFIQSVYPLMCAPRSNRRNLPPSPKTSR